MAEPFQKISVIVPENPFRPKDFTRDKVCLCVLDVDKLMDWWPGKPHVPHRNAKKVIAIQRSLDWKRVAQIAAYLLQEEIQNVPEKLDECFREIYEPQQYEPGREWPPRVASVIGYEKSQFREFSNVLIHVNGATLKKVRLDGKEDAANLEFNEEDPNLYFSVIDGQHRINGAYFAVSLLRKTQQDARMELPAEVFLDLDKPGEQPRLQAQIFIDVNYYQKRVDRSLVADLFPTTRGERDPIGDKERAQDIGRKLMLERGPLVGMIQIPGIKFGVKNVVTLATLNAGIEDHLETLQSNGIRSLESQTDFFVQCLEAWLEAIGGFKGKKTKAIAEIDPSNVAYQGRVLVSMLTLIPAMIWHLRSKKVELISSGAMKELVGLFKTVTKRAGLLKEGVFMTRDRFKSKGFLGSGGVARFRDLLWSSVMRADAGRLRPETLKRVADDTRARIALMLEQSEERKDA